MEKRYTCCIFDLDGTIINTIHALTHTTNLVLGRFGLGPLSEERVKKIVGDGYKKQMERSLLACGEQGRLLILKSAFPVYREVFSGKTACIGWSLMRG